MTDDPRPDPPLAAPPLAMLEAFLDFHRETLLWKIAGLSDEELRRPMVPSGVCLLGIVKHSAYVERWWFRSVFAGEDLPSRWSDTGPRRRLADRVGRDDRGDPRALSGRNRAVARNRATSAGREYRLGRAGEAARARPQLGLDHDPHGRGGRPPQRPRRHPARADRRQDRRVVGAATARRWVRHGDPPPHVASSSRSPSDYCGSVSPRSSPSRGATWSLKSAVGTFWTTAITDSPSTSGMQ